jgi:type IV pilus assembly protein PilO
MNRVFDQLMKRSRSERFLLFGIGYALIAALFYFVLISPTLTNIADMTKQQGDLIVKRDEVKRRAANRAQFEAELARMSEDLKEALKQLPNDREIPGLLSEIDEQGRKAGLEVRKFQPLPEVMHEYYAEVPVSIVMDGGYHEVGTFFDAVRQMDRIVSMIDITLSNPVDAGGDTNLTVSGKAVTYRFLTDEEIAKKKNDTGKKGRKKGGGGGEE